jgi:nucleoside-diphosphate-sugar epimerase
MAEFGYAGIFDERAPCRPDTSYGAAKLACTHYALATRLTHQLDIRVARLFGVYGPGENAQRLLPKLVPSLLAGKAVPLSDGLQLRDFVHVDDVTAALQALAEIAQPPGPLINIGTGVGVTVRAVCEMVADILGADPELMQFGALPRRIVDQDVLVAKTEMLALLHDVPAQRWLAREQVENYVRALAA